MIFLNGGREIMEFTKYRQKVKSKKSLFLFFFSSFSFFVGFFSVDLFAQQVVLMCATIAPENSPWAELIKKASLEIQEKTGGAVKTEWYFSSIAGDEPEICLLYTSDAADE